MSSESIIDKPETSRDVTNFVTLELKKKSNARKNQGIHIGKAVGEEKENFLPKKVFKILF